MNSQTFDNPQSAIRNPQSPVTDSPWFWVLVFSLMALLALAVIGPKYGRRQAGMEVKYQARERIAEDQAAGNNLVGDARSELATDRRELASPEDTLVPLWPLAAILVVVALVSYVMLIRRGSAVQPASAGGSPLS
jgi:hypothetical protein